MQKPITVVNKTPLKFVLVTMDTHLLSASEKASFALKREMPNLDFKIHAAAGWATAPEKLAECKKDIAEADIVVTTMLFLRITYEVKKQALLACFLLLRCISKEVTLG